MPNDFLSRVQKISITHALEFFHELRAPMEFRRLVAAVMGALRSIVKERKRLRDMSFFFILILFLEFNLLYDFTQE